VQKSLPDDDAAIDHYTVAFIPPGTPLDLSPEILRSVTPIARFPNMTFGELVELRDLLDEVIDDATTE